MSLFNTIKADISIVGQHLPAIVSVVKTAETAFPLPGSGAAKLDFVLQILGALNTGLTPDSLSAIIGIVVTLFNKYGVFTQSKPATVSA